MSNAVRLNMTEQQGVYTWTSPGGEMFSVRCFLDTRGGRTWTATGDKGSYLDSPRLAGIRMALAMVK